MKLLLMYLPWCTLHDITVRLTLPKQYMHIIIKWYVSLRAHNRVTIKKKKKKKAFHNNIIYREIVRKVLKSIMSYLQTPDVFEV